MISPTMPGVTLTSARQSGEGRAQGAASDERSDIGKRFEQMLWAEMLTHAGLEKSLTLGGGEAASAFSRYVVEAIAEDLAESHPLGLARKVDEVTAGQKAVMLSTNEIPDE
ncbi:MAG: hypothetical protein ACK4M6_00900 [Hyphomonas sp.]